MRSSLAKRKGSHLVPHQPSNSQKDKKRRMKEESKKEAKKKPNESDQTIHDDEKQTSAASSAMNGNLVNKFPWNEPSSLLAKPLEETPTSSHQGKEFLLPKSSPGQEGLELTTHESVPQSVAWDCTIHEGEAQTDKMRKPERNHAVQQSSAAATMNEIMPKDDPLSESCLLSDVPRQFCARPATPVSVKEDTNKEEVIHNDRQQSAAAPPMNNVVLKKGSPNDASVMSETPERCSEPSVMQPS